MGSIAAGLADDYVNGDGSQDRDDVVIKDGASDGYRIQVDILLPDGRWRHTTAGGNGTVERLETDNPRAGEEVLWAVSINNFTGGGARDWRSCELPGTPPYGDESSFIE